MKNFYKYISLSVVALSTGFTACHNAENEFDDFEDGVSVYFPYQTPIRTLVMGEDIYNTDLDNAHKCKISTTMGGSYTGKNIIVEVAKDEFLLTNLYFKGGDKIEAMPEDYYDLSSTTMDFAGTMKGSIEVSLKDAFFNDEKSVAGGYVIPLVIKNQTGAAKINIGSYDTQVYSSAPQRTNNDAWKTLPQDYTLFCIKYISKYEGYFMRRITNYNGADSIHITSLPELPDYPVAVGDFRYKQGTDSIRKYYIYNSNEPIVNTKTVNLNKVTYEAGIDGTNYTLVLDFTAGTVSAPEGATYTVSGKCAYKEHSEKKAWGDKDRDGLYIDYSVTDGTETYDLKEILVLQRRGVALSTFETEYKEEE